MLPLSNSMRTHAHDRRRAHGYSASHLANFFPLFPLLGRATHALTHFPMDVCLVLVANVFEGNHFGPRDKDNIDLWQTILTAAVRAERQ